MLASLRLQHFADPQISDTQASQGRLCWGWPVAAPPLLLFLVAVWAGSFHPGCGQHVQDNLYLFLCWCWLSSDLLNKAARGGFRWWAGNEQVKLLPPWVATEIPAGPCPCPCRSCYWWLY